MPVGEYRCSTNASAATLINCPTSLNFKLTIEERQGTERLFMTLKDSYANIYYNSESGENIWTGWKKNVTEEVTLANTN